jgi:hypothetical protein
MDFDVEHASVLPRPDGRRAGHRRKKLSLGDDAQPAGTFRDQHAAIRNEGDGPRRFQSSGHDLQPDRLPFGLHDVTVRVDVDLWPPFRGRGLLADVEHELAHGELVEDALERRHRRARHALQDHTADARVVGAVLPFVVDEARRGAALKIWPVAAGAILRVQRDRRLGAVPDGNCRQHREGGAEHHEPRGRPHHQTATARWATASYLNARPSRIA